MDFFCITCYLRILFVKKITEERILFLKGVVNLLKKRLGRSRKIRFVKADDVESNVPTTLTPVQEANVEKSNKQRLAAICGGAAVALLVVIVLALLYFCLTRLKRLTRRSSVAESSFPSSSGNYDLKFQ